MKHDTNTVWIFGDSFADPNYANDLHQTVNLDSWPNRLAQTYTVENFARSGTGPDYSLNLLLDALVEHQDRTHDISVIYLASDNMRLNLVNRFYQNPSQQVHLIDIANKEIKHSGYMFAKNIFQYLITEEWNRREIVKQFGSINSLAGCFKRVAYIPVTGGYPLYDDLYTVADNLSYVSYVDNHALVNISISEPEYSAGIDPRSNHFSPRCHDYLYNSFDRWLKGHPLDLLDLAQVAANV
jgi:hypothetical protein